MFSESTGTVCVDESRLQLGRQSRWWFLSRQRLSFHLRFWSQQELYVLTNPCDSCGSNVVDGLWVDSYWAFADDFRVHKDCVRGRIQASTMEAVSLMFSDSTATQFSPVISESTTTMCPDKSMSQLWRQFRWLFLSCQLHCFRWRLPCQQGMCAQTKPNINYGSSFGDNFKTVNDLVFGDDFWVKWDCVRWWIQASSGETVSLIVSESAATQFSLAISESTRTLCTDESTRKLWKQCRWWFLSRQLLSFRWWFPSQ